MERRYRDRREAGRALTKALSEFKDKADLIVLGLPRGGLPVAKEIADDLKAPLDVFVVRKLGVPGHEELAFGAIASGGVRVLNDDVIRNAQITEETVARATSQEQLELNRRERAYRGDRPEPDVGGRTVLLVDDGLATGSTMTAAVRALRVQHPERIIVAVPVGASSTCEVLRAEADEVVCPLTPEPMGAIGMWYEDFEQTDDDEVRRLLSV